MKCYNCEYILPEDSEFCQYCGNKISGDSSEISSISNEEFKPIISVASEVKVAKPTVLVKKKQKTKNSPLDIINIFVLILPFIFSLIGIVNWYDEEELFAMIFFIGFLPLLLKILNVVKLKNNIIATIIIAGFLFVMMCCSFGCDIEMGLPICLTTSYLLICEICKIIKCGIEKYHRTHSYRMKCYKKINLLNEYREKRVITEAEYEETRKQIISKIHN